MKGFPLDKFIKKIKIHECIFQKKEIEEGGRMGQWGGREGGRNKGMNEGRMEEERKERKKRKKEEKRERR